MIYADIGTIMEVDPRRLNQPGTITTEAPSNLVALEFNGFDPGAILGVTPGGDIYRTVGELQAGFVWTLEGNVKR